LPQSRNAEQFFHVFWSTEIEEHAVIVIEVFLYARKYVWRVPWIRHEPVIVRTAIDGPQYRTCVQAHFVENDNQLICNVIEVAWGHAVDYSIERHATAFIHEEIPHAVRYSTQFQGSTTGSVGKGA
jgi:hypothetical protein